MTNTKKASDYRGEVVTIDEKHYQYEIQGLCSYCFESLEALMPGGIQVRHLVDQRPYGMCEKALRAHFQ